MKEFEGYGINLVFTILTQEIKLKEEQLFTSKINHKEIFYDSIDQYFIKKSVIRPLILNQCLLSLIK